MIANYSHVVSVEDRGGKRVVRICRLIDGRTDFYTEADLHCSEQEADWDEFEKLSVWLGKSICIDSPIVRQCLGIEGEAKRGQTHTDEGNGVAVELQAFIERGEVLEPFFLRISAPTYSQAEDFYCKVHAPALLKRDAEIFGVDAEQARELAVRFIKSMLGEAKLVDQDRHPIDW